MGANLKVEKRHRQSTEGPDSCCRRERGILPQTFGREKEKLGGRWHRKYLYPLESRNGRTRQGKEHHGQGGPEKRWRRETARWKRALKIAGRKRSSGDNYLWKGKGNKIHKTKRAYLKSNRWKPSASGTRVERSQWALQIRGKKTRQRPLMRSYVNKRKNQVPESQHGLRTVRYQPEEKNKVGGVTSSLNASVGGRRSLQGSERERMKRRLKR